MISTSPGRIGTLARDVAVVDQVAEANRDARLLVALLPDEHGTVAGRELREAADGDHHVEQRHVGAVGQRLRLGGLPDHADLVGVGADEARHHHADGRVAHELGQRHLEILGQLRRRLARRRHARDQRRGDHAVRAHRHGDRQFRLVPDEHLQRVARADAVFGLLGLGLRRHRHGDGLRRARAGREQRAARRRARTTGLPTARSVCGSTSDASSSSLVCALLGELLRAASARRPWRRPATGPFTAFFSSATASALSPFLASAAA